MHSAISGRVPHRIRVQYWAGLFAAAVLLCVITTVVNLSAEMNDAAQQRADYYLNVLKFTLWPEAEAGENTLDVLLYGEGDVCSVLLQMIPTIAVNERSIAIAQLRRWSSRRTTLPKSLRNAEAVFFCSDSASSYRALLPRLPQHVLTASTIPNFARAGGMVEIADIDHDAQPEFLINTEALRNGDVAISSQLLKMAEIVSEVSSVDSRKSAKP